MPSSLTDADYLALAEFRFSLRQFQAFSEQKAEECGLTPQQHQALLVIRAAPAGTATIGYVAERLILKPHSATGLVEIVVADLDALCESSGGREYGAGAERSGNKSGFGCGEPEHDAFLLKLSLKVCPVRLDEEAMPWSFCSRTKAGVEQGPVEMHPAAPFDDLLRPLPELSRILEPPVQ